LSGGFGTVLGFGLGDLHDAFKEDIDETVRTFVADRKRIDGENRVAHQKKRSHAT